MSERTALFWRAAGNGAVVCELCPRLCRIAAGGTGFCRVRKNIGGRLAAESYGLLSALCSDPVEKKPLSRFMPGKRVLSLGSFGCNLSCPFCQNHEIAADFDMRGAKSFSPEEIVRLALKSVPEGNIGAAYTYNEPTVNYEFMSDCAALVREAGLLNVVVTNGYIRGEALEALLPLIDAMNIDLKAFSEGFYKKIGGDLETVKKTIARARARCHVEVTTLVIPGENEKDVEGLAAWLSSLDPGIPLHLSRFFPRHKYSRKEPTPRESIYKSAEIAGKYLTCVYAGNM